MFLVWGLGLVTASRVSLESCPLSCSLNGECHELYEDGYSVEALYLCECFEGFAGYACNECFEGHYGHKCEKCPSQEGKICAGRGLCNSGKEGNGKCLCYGGFLPETNCEEELLFEDKEVKVTTTVTLLLCAAILCVLTVYAFPLLPMMQYLPECVASVLLGLVCGYCLTYYPSLTVSGVNFFDPQAFFLLILPPIMFDAGYHTDKRNFLRNFGTILLFSVVGTVIAALVYTFILLIGQFFLSEPRLSVLECLMFGSLIVSVDPVATRAVFKTIKLDTVLHMIVFGESSLNDAVTIALFRTFSSFQKREEELSLGEAFGLFNLQFFGSIGVGVIFGLLSALLFKYLNLREKPTFETALFMLWSYIPFVFCEAVGLSGILGILFVAMVMVHYTHYSLSRPSQNTTRQLFRSVAFLAETCCFVILGLTIPFMESKIRWSFIPLAIIALVLSRTCSVFSTGFVANLFRKKPISYKNMVIIWWSGIRGAVSFALALNFPTGRHDLVISTTMVIAMFTIFAQGGTTKPLLSLMDVNVTGMVKSKHGYLVDIDYEEEDDSGANTPAGDRVLHWLEELDARYMQKWFRHAELQVRPG